MVYPPAVSVFEVLVQTKDRLCFVMEYVNGGEVRVSAFVFCVSVFSSVLAAVYFCSNAVTNIYSLWGCAELKMLICYQGKVIISCDAFTVPRDFLLSFENLTSSKIIIQYY